MKPPMLHTAYKVTTTRNAYGDYIASGETALACHFRDITQVAQRDRNEQIDADALAWFEPDSGIVKNDIVKIEGQHFQVDRVIKARKLRNPNVQFIKCELVIYGVIS